METISRSTEEVLESAPARLADIVALYQWGTNYDWEHNPWALFLDLIGYSVQNYGETIYNTHNTPGYMELDYIGDALKCYADRPLTAWEFIEQLEGTE
jgi:hypothetical protein